MEETRIAFIIFFTSIIIFAQVKIIRQFIIRKRLSSNTKGIIYSYSTKYACCEACCCCCLEALYGERIRREKETKYEKDVEKQKIKDLKEYQEKKELTIKEDIKLEKEFITEEEVKERIKDLADDKEKTNLQWLSTITAIPIERIVKTLAEDTNFIIENDYVINKKMLVKEEKMGIRERIERAQLREIRKKKLEKNICPKCNNSFEPSSIYCLSCGIELKKEI
ncbi:MAG: hypothetical protein FK731_02955 [Asgard group archaeon]|nr:hypothetical protein [Asgard group archaeon]